MWADKRAEALYSFRMQLELPALKLLLDDPERLAELRYDIKQLDSYKRMLGNAIRELKIDLDEVVLKASRPDWDSEDDEKEEKNAAMPPAPPTHDPKISESSESSSDIEPNSAMLRAKRLAHFAKTHTES